MKFYQGISRLTSGSLVSFRLGYERSAVKSAVPTNKPSIQQSALSIQHNGQRRCAGMAHLQDAFGLWKTMGRNVAPRREVFSSQSQIASSLGLVAVICRNPQPARM